MTASDAVQRASDRRADAAPRSAARSRRAVAVFLLVALGVLAFDLALKRYAFEHVAGRRVNVTHENNKDPDLIPPHDGIVLVPGVLNLQLTLNHGAVFGIGQGGRWVFIVITIAAVIIIALVFARSAASAWLTHVGLAMILGGALGNLYDRFFCGAVRDMLNLFPDTPLPFGWSWPGGARDIYPWIFNIADAALVAGVIAIMLVLLRSKSPAARGEP